MNNEERVRKRTSYRDWCWLIDITRQCDTRKTMESFFDWLNNNRKFGYETHAAYSQESLRLALMDKGLA